MKKFLVSIIASIIAFPAVADNITNSIFGRTGNEQVACSVNVLGQSENESTAMTEAYWILDTYNCSAGQYLYSDLANNIVECRECPTNHYCGGGTYSVESVNNGAVPCPANTFAAAGNTTISECVSPKFTLTIDSSKSKYMSFMTTASGTFYVDWGDGTIQKIVRPNVTGYTWYSHTYATNGIYTMHMAGQATGYSTTTESNKDTTKWNDVAITFAGDGMLAITGISGSIGSIFSTIDNGETLAKQPRFSALFGTCTNLTGNIPSNLFSDVHGKPARHMFKTAFWDTKLTGSIPETLFCENPNNPDITNCIYGAPAEAIFSNTFNGSTGLTGSIPPKLFVGIHGAPAPYMFSATFYACTGLTGSIPETLFCQNPNAPDITNCIYGAPAERMFGNTFYKATGLTGTNIDDPNNPGKKYAIPPTLFAGIHGAPAAKMFYFTFANDPNLTGTIPGTLFCQNPDAPDATNCIYGAPATEMFAATFQQGAGLTGSIPAGLFAGIRGTPADTMYRNTFQGAYNLTGSIPNKLFGELSGAPAANMFNSTFRGASKLTGYIPTDLFGTISGTRATGDFNLVFDGTALETACPANEYRHYFEFQDSFSSKVGCDVCPNNGLSAAGSLSVDACYITCDATLAVANGIRTLIGDNPNHYYTNGAYPACEYDTTCDTGYHANVDQCTANVINVIWYGADANNAYHQNTCTYNDTITLPETNPTRIGYEFNGWKLRETTPSQEQGE